MTSGVKPIHQLGGSTLMTAGSFPTFSCAWAAVREQERRSTQHQVKSGRENKRQVTKGQNFFTPEE
jgi:hypothetical protein